MKEKIFCEFCRFYEPHNESPAGVGECRKNAPRPIGALDCHIADILGEIAWQFIDGTAKEKKDMAHGCEATEGISYAWFPIVSGDFWCGEFRKKGKSR